MPKGQVLPAEWSEYRDRTTGLAVKQLTNSPPHHNVHFYFHDPAWSADSAWLVFRSNRTGKGELFGLRMATGQLVQLTEGGAGGAAVSQRRPVVYYSAGAAFHVVDLETLEDRSVGTLPEGVSCYSGPSENADGSLLVFGGNVAGRRGILSMSVGDGAVTTVWETAGLPSHVNCSLSDPGWIMHCDSTVPDEKPKQRVWVLSADGKKHWHPYTQTPQEWLTHESWLGTTGKLLICYWPTGIMEIDVDGTNRRLIAAVNAWHAGATRDGRYCVVDTNWPDRGIHLIERATGRMTKLCESDSGAGNARANVEVHPHPSFSPDGRYVVFGSQKTGSPEIYAVDTAQAHERPNLWWEPGYRWHRW